MDQPILDSPGTVVNMEQPHPAHILDATTFPLDGTGTVALGPCTVPCPSSQAHMLSSTTEPRSEPDG